MSEANAICKVEYRGHHIELAASRGAWTKLTVDGHEMRFGGNGVLSLFRAAIAAVEDKILEERT